MPDYGERARIYPARARVGMRWRLIAAASEYGGTAQTQGTAYAPVEPGDIAFLDQTITQFGARNDPMGTGSAFANWATANPYAFISPVSIDGIDLTAALGALPNPISMRMASGGEAWAFVFSGDARAIDKAGQAATGYSYFRMHGTGLSVVASAGAGAVGSVVGAEVSIADDETGARDMWVGVADAGSEIIDPAFADQARLPYALETATLETRWQGGAFAGRAVRWRGRLWQVDSAQVRDRRRVVQIDLRRRAT